ncbi:hypothetical protein [Streptomyces scopuliridis]|uniref:Uncharacterized protein n=1 Tax=Streptomyces scopuliridis TaxID=452529 RepID=A0ACD4ZQH0_9ACTN|nr:hypothetical protein [Streptomyces scopuliridis]WSC00057.1 hypothetical protein OG835_25730 [Streptomyces scopuliridis]
MTRKKTARVRIEVLTSFNGMVAGDTGTVDLDERVQSWINVGLVKRVGSNGTDQAGSGSTEQDDPRGQPTRTGSGRQAAAEPGPDPGAG